MQLNSHDAVRLGYVRDSKGNLLNPAEYNKNSSVDITIGEVIYKDKREGINSGLGTTLKPQQSLVIISDEIISVPNDHVAYVFLKNRLSQRGLLALNTGIIDSGYVGPISTVIINFSNEDAVIPLGKTKEKKEFFRVVFHKIDPNSNQISGQSIPSISFNQQQYDDYKSDKIETLKNLPKTFLEPRVLKDQIRDEIYSKISEFSLIKVGLMIAVIGLFFTLTSMGRDFWFGWQYDIKNNIATQEKNELKIDNLNSDIDKLKEQVHKLEISSNKRN